MAGGAVWIPVNASMKGFVSSVVKEASGAADRGGRVLEDGFKASGEKSGAAVADGLAAQAKKVEAASRVLATARAAESTAARDVLVAEEKLTQVRSSGGASASDIAKAESDVAVAKAKAADAADRVAKRTADLDAVRSGEAATARTLVSAEDQLSKARVDAEKASGALRVAELRVTEVREAQQDGAAKVAAAEKNLIDVRDRFGAGTKEATAAARDLERAQRELDKTSVALARAEGDVGKARGDLASATDAVMSKELVHKGVVADLAAETDRAAESTEELAASVDGSGSIFDSAQAKVAGFAAGIAGIAGIGGAIATGMDVSGSISMMNMQLGLAGEAAAVVGDEVKEVMSGGVAGSAEEAAEAVGALHSNIRYLGSEGEQTAAELADNFLGVSEVFGVDMAEAAQVAGQLLTNGLAADAEHAADLMTVAMQRVPVAMRDEIPDIINEYGTFFSSMGMDGADAFGLIVNAAQNGKIEMDKVGDAIKEFSIRASDLGDTGAVEALDALGLAGADVQNRLLAGGETAKGAFDQVVESLLAVKDPAEQAEMAVALFGTPLEDLDKAKIPAFLAGMNDAAAVMGDVDGASQALADTMAGSLSGRLDALKGTAAALAGDGFMFLWDKAVLVSDWAKDNESWLSPLLVGFGALAGVVGGVAVAQNLWNAALGVYKTIQAVATGQQLLFNAALLANPITWFVAALAGLTAGLVYFFTQTESGQKIWSDFTDTVKRGWDTAVEAVRSGIDWFRDVLDDWSDRVESARDAWSDFVERVLDLWDSATSALLDGWEAVKSGVFDAWNAVVAGVKATWDTITGAIAAAWTWMKDQFVYVWTVVKATVFDAWNAAVTWVQEKFGQVTGAISSSWSWLKDQLHAGYTWVKSNVLDALTSSLDTVKGWFDKTVDAIGVAWDKLRELTAKPVNFVIDVYNDGIKGAWDKVAGLVGLPDLPQADRIGGFAQGVARVPGARTRHDNVDMIARDGRFALSLRGGESVLVPEVADALGERTIDNLNRIGLREGAGGVARYVEHLGGYADGTARIRRQTPYFGGAVSPVQRSQETFVERFFPHVFTLTSATRFTDTGLHSKGLATDWQDNGAQRPTPRSKALARAIETNFPNSQELIHWPLDGWNNLYAGRPHSYSAGTNAQHQNHVHWGTLSAIEFNGDDIVLSDVPGGGVFESVVNMARRLWDSAIAAIPTYDGDGSIAELPGAWVSTVASAAWDWIAAKAAALMPGSGTSGAGAEQWRDTARAALRRFGYMDDTYLDAMVRQIEIESSGNPTAVNDWDINAQRGTPSGGLLQVIEPTYRDVRRRYPEAFEGLPDDRFHPLTNMVAGIGALKRDWGGLEGGRWPTTAGYADGTARVALPTLFDRGGLWPSGTLGVNLSGADEFVWTGAQWADFRRLIDSLEAVAPHLSAIAGNREARSELEWAAAGRGRGVDALAKVVGDDLAGALEAAVSAPMAGVTAEITRVSDQWYAIGEGLSGPWIDSTSVVVEALEDLEAARKAAAESDASVADARKALADAQKELDDALNGTAETSTSTARKIEDAEAALDKARAEAADATSTSVSATRKISDAEKALAQAREDGKADKIAAAEERLARAREDQSTSAADSATKASEKVAEAEKRLARAREDEAEQREKDEKKRAENVEKAREKVAKAEEAVAKAQKEVVTSADKVVEAERRVASARLQAVGQVSTGVLSGIATVLDGVAQFTSRMAELAGQLTATEDRLRSMRVESATLELQRLAALGRMNQAERDLEEARVSGAAVTRRIGDTSVTALGRALEQFRTTGVMSVDLVAEAAADAAREVGAIQGEQHDANRQAAIAAKVAAVDFLIASLKSQEAARIQALLAEKQAAQQAAMWGLSEMQYRAITGFVQGIVKIISGIVKIGVAVAGVVAALPLGPAAVIAAAAAIPAAISGIADIAVGVELVKTHHDGAREAWEAMDDQARFELLVAAGGAVAPAVGGAVVSLATGSLDPLIGSVDGMRESTDAMFGMLSELAEIRMGAVGDEYDRQIKAIEDDTAQTIAELQMIREGLSLIGEGLVDEVDFPGLLALMRDDSAKTTDLVGSVSRIESTVSEKKVIDLVIPAGSAWTDEELDALLRDVFSRLGDVELNLRRLDKDSAMSVYQATK